MNPVSTTMTPRMVVAAVALGLSALGTLLPAGGWSTSVLILSAGILIASAIADHRLTAVSALPIAITLLLVAAVCWGLLLALLPVGWASRPAAIAVWWSILLVAAVVVWRRRRTDFHFVGPDVAVGIVGLFVLAAFAALAVWQPTEVWLRHVALGTDFARHVTILGGTVADGGIDLTEGSVYPRGLHAMVGVAWRAGGGTQFVTAWSALQGCVVLLLAVMAMGLTAAGQRWARTLSVPRLWVDWLIPAATVVAVVQGMWLAAMMAGGFITSIAAGLILAAVVSVISVAGSWRSSWLVALVASAAAAMAYSWPILVGVPVVVAVASWVAGGVRRRGTLALAGGAVVAAPAILVLAALTVTSGEYRSEIVAGAPVLLWWPEWWWWLLIVLGVTMLAALWRVARGNAAAVLFAWGAAALTVIGIAVLTGATAAAPGYYLLKTIWTASNLVLPAGLVGGAWVIATLWRKAATAPAPRGTLIKGGVVAAVFLLAVAALGRLTANAQTWDNVTKGFGEVPLTYATLEYLESQNVSLQPGQAVAVWGLSPYGTLGSVQNAGMQDRYITDAVRWLGSDIIRPEIPVTVGRDAAGMCRFLAANPGAMRITGPSDKPGIGWLRAVGCPESVIRPGQWLHVPLADGWFEYLTMAGQPYDYPEWTDYRDQMRQQDPAWGTYVP